jgi:putative ABC transport system permease protein
MLARDVLVRLAWRNVRRNRRRSFITVLSIALGLAALTFLWGFIDGMNGQMVENTTRYLAGDVQVHTKGYHDAPNLDLAISRASPVLQAIARDPGVAAASVRLEGKTLASNGDRSKGVLLVGISPREEARVTSVLDALTSGVPLRAADTTGVLIGEKLAESLHLSVGSDLVLVGQAYDGSVASARVPVRGIFRTKIDEYDRVIAIMPLVAVREFLAAPEGATAIVLHLRDRSQLSSVTARLGAQLGARYEVLGWPALLPMVATSARYHEVMGVVVLAIFFVVVAAGVANPVLMAVLERTREFGVMLAVGMSPGRLLRLVVWEALLLGILGVLLGNVIGLGVTFVFGRVGIDLSAFEAGLRTMPGLADVIRPVVRIERSVVISALVFGIACLVALYPAAKAARLDPVRAIRGITARWRLVHAPRPHASPSAEHTRREPKRSRWPVFVLLAARNVMRNVRRTAITAFGAAFVIVAYIFLFGYFDGFGEQAIDTSTRYLTGHLQIELPGFRTDFAPELTLGRPDTLLARLRGVPHVLGAAPRVQAQAIASSPTQSEGIALIGIDPVLERDVTFIHKTIVSGAALERGRDRDVVLGRKLAEKLAARVGDKVVIMSQAAGGELGTSAYRVSGIFATESASFDGGMAFVTLPAAQALLSLGERVSTINVRLDDRSALEHVMAQLGPVIGQAGYRIAPWQELLPSLDEMIKLVIVIRTIIMSTFLAVVVLAVMNTVFMSVAERTRELGVMMALGTRPAAVVRIILYETATIMVVASLIGYVAGALLVGYFGRNGLDLSSFFKDYSSIPGLTGIVYPRLVLGNVVLPGVLLFVASLLISAYPAVRAARLDPALAIHSR